LDFGFSDLGNFLVFSLDIWIRLICYQSTSETKIYSQENVNKSRISQFQSFGIYRCIRKINSSSPSNDRKIGNVFLRVPTQITGAYTTEAARDAASVV